MIDIRTSEESRDPRSEEEFSTHGIKRTEHGIHVSLIWYPPMIILLLRNTTTRLDEGEM